MDSKPLGLFVHLVPCWHSVCADCAQTSYHINKREMSRCPSCRGVVKHIGMPLREAVFRTNHALSPLVMRHQEPLFNNTAYRYELLHDLIAGVAAAGDLIDEVAAVRIAATLGIKGDDMRRCRLNLHSLWLGPAATIPDAGADTANDTAHDDETNHHASCVFFIIVRR